MCGLTIWSSGISRRCGSECYFVAFMKKVAIDVGHARLSGARGCGYEEHELCAKMAPLLKDHLERNGFQADVIDFPSLSNKADLVETVKAINAGGYDCSVSLHCDASDNVSARGAHVCYVSARGALLAGAIASHLCPLMPGRVNRTVRRSDLFVLNNTRPVAVLVECGFITNAQDCALLADGAVALMRAVAQGVKEFLA